MSTFKDTSTTTKATTKATTPAAAFTYTVKAEQGMAPAGRIFVYVTVTPDGDYTVTYDGVQMQKQGGKYFMMVKSVDGYTNNDYRTHVSVKKN